MQTNYFQKGKTNLCYLFENADCELVEFTLSFYRQSKKLLYIFENVQDTISDNKGDKT